MAVIMVVDDEKNLLESLGRMLKNEGYEVKLVSSGKEALGLLEEFKPQAILLDIKMPEMDGLEVCRRIRAGNTEYLKTVPILVITGYPVIKEEVLKAGADDFVEKPIDRTDITIRLRCALKIAKFSDGAERRKTYLEELKNSGMEW